MSIVGFSSPDYFDPWQNVTDLLEENSYDRKVFDEFFSEHVVYHYKDGGLYQGEVLNGEYHGQGICRYADGSVYQGEFLNGEYHGQGMRKYSDGSFYRGEFLNGEYHGQGICQHEDGSVYQGEFLNGEPHGHGMHQHPDGTFYRGDILNGRYHGQGTYQYGDGSVYQGAFLNGDCHGQGTCRHASGSSYQGEFLNDLEHGQGILTFSNGAVYQGEFFQGQSHGQGTYKNFNGEIYQGEHRCGVRHGKGRLIQTNGIEREVSFFNAIRIDSNESELGDALFVDLLFGGEVGAGSGYALGIMASYLSSRLEGKNQQLAGFLDDAHKLYQMDSHAASQKIYDSLQEGFSYLLPYGYKDHDIGLFLVPSEDKTFIDCEIFNSGDGLSRYHARNHELDKYQTMLRVRVPFEALTRDKIEKFLKPLKIANAEECYQQILGILNRQILTSLPDEIVWQAGQKGGNCSLEWIFAYLKNNMPVEQYDALRKELFLDCLEIAGKTTKHLPFDKKIPSNLIPKIRQKLFKLQITPEEKVRVWAYGYSRHSGPLPNGNVYEGDYLYGIPDGIGFEKRENGVRCYVGEFCNGVYQGQGIYQYQDGDIYQGAFSNGIPHGFGIASRMDGSVYEGNFSQGKFDGQGACKYQNGDFYRGTFCNGAPHGQGVRRTASGEVFEGDFFEGYFCG